MPPNFHLLLSKERDKISEMRDQNSETRKQLHEYFFFFFPSRKIHTFRSMCMT
ncbi:predicted protein [Botrytis cinerea T4]|uniref:Uncharacterized protein n=1 Tax=Botryotinia fuckeliana (strain T4) TaxID=999810 RepID=G2YEG1_BOTF4|nr:predicted protein [Botrytis cinerea T4]